VFAEPDSEEEDVTPSKFIDFLHPSKRLTLNQNSTLPLRHPTNSMRLHLVHL
jgi:hypothetical protein